MQEVSANSSMAKPADRVSSPLSVSYAYIHLLAIDLGSQEKLLRRRQPQDTSNSRKDCLDSRDLTEIDERRIQILAVAQTGIFVRPMLK